MLVQKKNSHKKKINLALWLLLYKLNLFIIKLVPNEISINC